MVYNHKVPADFPRSRTDQKDVATLLSYYSNIDITIIDGVEEVSPKAIPGGHGKGKLSDGEIGCWRVHMNMLKIVVEKRLETALIMEADADWDIRIKDQLTNLSDNLLDSTPKHPYGQPLPPKYSSFGEDKN